MPDIETFREQVEYYLSQAEYESDNKRADKKRRMTKGDLADACGISRSELSRKLNSKSPMNSLVVQSIVRALADHHGITTKRQAKELLTLMGAPDFSPAAWRAFPLDFLEDDIHVQSRFIAINDPGIPRLFNHFLGRDDLLNQLRTLLCSNTLTSPIALYGNPGVGKTAIATAIANDPTVQQYFQGGILWAGLGIKPERDTILERWRQLLQIEDINVKALHLALSSRPALLILDDVCGVEDVKDFFQLSSYNNTCRYLITTISRDTANQLTEKHAFSFSVTEFGPEQGFDLLHRLAPISVEADQAAARTLIEDVGGLPLAIWLMGMYLANEESHGQPGRLRDAWARLREYERRLRWPRPLLDLKPFPSLAESSKISLEAVIGVRYEALDETSQQMLRALAIFPAKPNTFFEDTACAVIAAPSGQAFRDRLVDAGLVEDVGGDRYTVHQTIHDFAYSKLTKERGECEAANERLARFFAKYVHHHSILRVDEINLNQALQWAYDHKLYELYLAIASGMQHFWRDHWSIGESIEHLSRSHAMATAIYKATHDSDSLHTMMALAYTYGSTLLIANRLDETKEVFEHILSIACIAPDWLKEETVCFEGLAHLNLGVVALQEGNVDTAGDELAASLSSRSQAQYQDEWVVDFVTFCRIAKNWDALKVLQNHFEQALAIDRSVKNSRGECVALFSLGNIPLIRKEYAVARTLYHQCLVAVNKLEEQVSKGSVPHRQRETVTLAKGFALGEIASTSLGLKDLVTAKEYLTQSMEIMQSSQHRRYYAWTLLFALRLAAANSRKDEIPQYYRQGLRAAQDAHDQQYIAELCYYSGLLAEGEGHLDLAEELLRKSLAAATAVESPPHIADAQGQLGKVHLRQGKSRSEAFAMFSNAYQWYADMGIEDHDIKEIARQLHAKCDELYG